MRQAMEDWTAKNLHGGAVTTTSIIKETTDIIAKTQLLHLRKKQISSIVVDSGLSGGQEQNKTLKLLQEHHELNTELQSNPTVKAIQAGEYKNVSRVVTRKGEKATGFYGLIVSVLSALKRSFVALGRLLYRWKRTLIAVLLLCFYFYCTVTNYKNIYTMLQELREIWFPLKRIFARRIQGNYGDTGARFTE